MNDFLEPSLLEIIDPSSFKGATEKRITMTDKEIEDELLTDPEVGDDRLAIAAKLENS